MKGRKEIKEVFGGGRRFTCRGAKLFLLKNELPYNRICFSLSGVKPGFKNAVERNRARRLGCEAFRMMNGRLNSGYDLILLVYPGQTGARGGLRDRVRQLETLFYKAGLLI